MFHGWFIESGHRVCDHNVPLVAELRPHHRMTYAAHKEPKKFPTVGFCGRGCPILAGARHFAECPLRAEERGRTHINGIDSPTVESTGEYGR